MKSVKKVYFTTKKYIVSAVKKEQDLEREVNKMNVR